MTVNDNNSGMRGRLHGWGGGGDGGGGGVGGERSISGETFYPKDEIALKTKLDSIFI